MEKKIYITFTFFLLFLFVRSNLSAQQSEIDSLNRALQNATHDTTKVNLLNELTFLSFQTTPDSALIICEQAIKLSSEINYSKGLATAYKNKGNVYFRKNKYNKAIKFYLKSSELFAEIEDYIGQIASLSNTGKMYYVQGLSDSSIFYYEKTLAVSQKIENQSEISNCYKNIGNALRLKGDFVGALNSYQKSLEISKEINDKINVAQLYNNIGLIYHSQNNYNQSLEYYFKSLKFLEEIGNKNWLTYLYNNIGGIYNQKEEYDKAKEYYQKVVNIKLQIGDKNGLSITYQNLGGVYQNLFNEQKKDTSKNWETLEELDEDLLKSEEFARKSLYLDTALSYYEQNLKLNKVLENQSLIAFAYNSIGIIDEMRGNYDKALQEYLKSLKIREKLGEKESIAKTCNNIGGNYIKQKKNKKAIFYLEKSYNIAQEKKLKEIILFAAENLSKAYFYLKKYKQAHKYQVVAKKMNEFIYDASKKDELTQISMQHEFDKKQKLQKAEQEKKELAQKAELDRQKAVRNYFVLGFGLMIVLAIFIYRSYRMKNKANKLLAQQKEEIEAQRDEIEKQKHETEKQRDIAEKHRKHITDSILYASKIQTAILPPVESFTEALNDYFILFRPRDIVSGDFYWMTQRDDCAYVVAADCTGHGVPGAFMSMLGVSFLNEIVNKNNVLQPNLILNDLRNSVKKSLRQTGKSGEAKDGMDLALCKIDYQNMKVEFSGANNPLYIIRNKELIEVKPDKMPIGIYVREKESFTNHEVELQKGDMVYMFSDGYMDQIGGEKRRKFMKKRFKELLKKYSDKPMDEQKEVYDKVIDKWRGDLEQVDDILLVGIGI